MPVRIRPSKALQKQLEEVSDLCKGDMLVRRLLRGEPLSKPDEEIVIVHPAAALMGAMMALASDSAQKLVTRRMQAKAKRRAAQKSNGATEKKP